MAVEISNPVARWRTVRLRMLGLVAQAAILASFSGCGGCTDSTPPKPTPLSADDRLRLSNEGVGLMGQFNYEKATDIFQRLSDDDPASVDSRVDLAIVPGKHANILETLVVYETSRCGVKNGLVCPSLMLEAVNT